MAPTTLSSILAARAASSAAAAAAGASQGAADRATWLMRISDHASGMTPREGYAGWFRIESYSILKAEQQGRSPPTDDSVLFSVQRVPDAMTSKLSMLIGASFPLRFILIEAGFGSPDHVRFRFESAQVVGSKFVQGSRVLEVVNFKARAVSVGSPDPAR